MYKFVIFSEVEDRVNCIVSQFVVTIRDGSGAAGTSKMEYFVIIDNG